MVHHGPLMPRPPYTALKACNHRLGYASCYCQCVAPPPACTATAPYRHTAAFAYYLRVPVSMLTTDISPAAALLATCAVVKWLAYVHARRHFPCSLLLGPRDAPIPPFGVF